MVNTFFQYCEFQNILLSVLQKSGKCIAYDNAFGQRTNNQKGSSLLYDMLWHDSAILGRGFGNSSREIGNAFKLNKSNGIKIGKKNSNMQTIVISFK